MAATFVSISAVSLTNGIATALSNTQIFASSVVLYADNLNTGNVYLGGPSVTVSNGIPLAKNQSENLTYDLVYGVSGKIDLSQIFFDTDTTTNKIRALYVPWIGS